MVELSFAENWLNAQSPVSLSFPKSPNRVVLRFSESWGNFNSPAKLRFEGEVSPKPPIRDGGLGIDLVMPCLRPLQAETEVIISHQTDKVELTYPFDWLTHTATEQQNRTAWRIGGLQSVDKFLLQDTGKNIEQENALMWLSALMYQRSILLNRFSYKASETCLSAPWVIHATYQLDTNISFNSDDSLSSIFALRYSATGSDTSQQIVTVWGPHEAKWVCSTKYRPPAVGLLSMSFSESATNEACSPITLRFTESDKYCYFDDGGGLIEANPPLPSLDFKVPIEPQIRRAYLMQPTLTCTRVSDSIAIVLDSVSISDSRSQFTQSVSLQFSSAIDASRAENELLLIDINGYQFFALAEQPASSASFGVSSYSSAGRSRSALLATPWRSLISYTNDNARSFAGILGDLLTNSGWTIELDGVTDFTIPAGAFSTMGKSPIDAVNDAAAQIGCMLIPDEFASKLTIVPHWPTSPWLMDSAIADVNIHDSVILSFNRKKQINPLCNAAWVRGEQQGVSAKVKRAGTAGDIPTADISGQLIVDNQAARLAGTNAIAASGNKELISVSLPIMADLPPLKKGMLIGVTYEGEVFKATCDSVSISASMDQSSGLDISQSVNLIRHLE